MTDTKIKPFLINCKALGLDLSSKVMDCEQYCYKFRVFNGHKYEKDFILKTISDFLHPIKIKPYNYSKYKSCSYFFVNNCYDAIMKFVSNKLQCPNPLDISRPIRIAITANIPVDSLNIQQEASATENTNTVSSEKSFLINYKSLGPDLEYKLNECANSDYWHKFKVLDGRRYEKGFVLKAISDFLHPIEIRPHNYEIEKPNAYFIVSDCYEAILKLVSNQLQCPNPLDKNHPIRFSIMANFCRIEDLEIQPEDESEDYENIVSNTSSEEPSGLVKQSFLINNVSLGRDLNIKIQECYNSYYWHKFKVQNVSNFSKDMIFKIISGFLYPLQINPVNFTKDKYNAYFLARNCLDAIMKLISKKLQILNPLSIKNPIRISVMMIFRPPEFVEAKRTQLPSKKINYSDKMSSENSFLINYQQLSPDLSIRILRECNNRDYWHRFMVINARKYEKAYILKCISDFLDPLQLMPVGFERDDKRLFFLANNCLDAIIKLVSNQLQIPNPLDTNHPIRFSIMANLYPLDSLVIEPENTQQDIVKIFSPDNNLRKDEGHNIPSVELKDNAFLIDSNRLKVDLAIRILEECDNSNYWHKFIITNIKDYGEDRILQMISDFLNPITITPVLFKVDKTRAYFKANNCLEAIMKFIANRLQITDPLNDGPLRFTIIANFTPVESSNTQIKRGTVQRNEFPANKKRKHEVQGVQNDISFSIDFHNLDPDLEEKIISDCKNSGYWHKFIVTNAIEYEKNFIMKVFSDFLFPLQIKPVNFSRGNNCASFMACNCKEAIMKIVATKMHIPNRYCIERPIRVTIIANFCPFLLTN